MAVPDGPGEGFHARGAELLVHRDLRLDGRNKIADLIHDRAVELPDGLRRPGRRLAVSAEGIPEDSFRNEPQHGVKADHDGGPGLFDSFDQSVYHTSSL